MGREAVIENEAVLYGEKRGFLVRKCIYAGRRGSPDRWFFGRGYVFCVEFKKPGERPDMVQDREHKRLRECGTPVYVIDSIEKAWALIDSYTNLPIRAMANAS